MRGAVKIAGESRIVDAQHLGELGIQVERDVALAPFTTIKIGGPADFFAIVTNLEQLQALVQQARSSELPYFMLGGGSNILISDAGVRGLVIYNRCRAVEFAPLTDAGDAGHTGMVMRAESGAAMAGAARQSVNRGLSGLEWAVSLPGTVGGAVIGNAGAYGEEVKDNLLEACVIGEDGDRACLKVKDLAYGYRDSSLKRLRPLQAGFKTVVLDARFLLHQADADNVRGTADAHLAHRRSTQPAEPSLGSTFMNPPGDYAGRLIEAAGLKGMRVGGVEVSAMHANFLINRGGVGSARASDFMALVHMIQKEVQRRFAVELVPEIQLAGEW